MYLKLMTGGGAWRMIEVADVAFRRDNGSAVAEVRSADGVLLDTIAVSGVAFLLNASGHTIDSFAEAPHVKEGRQQ
jgi:hypothetical protein